MTVTRFNTELEECPVGALIYYVDYAALLEENSKLKVKLADVQMDLKEYEDDAYSCGSIFTWQEACE